MTYQELLLDLEYQIADAKTMLVIKTNVKRYKALVYNHRKNGTIPSYSKATIYDVKIAYKIAQLVDKELGTKDVQSGSWITSVEPETMDELQVIWRMDEITDQSLLSLFLKVLLA